jgi:hypothetical protein
MSKKNKQTKQLSPENYIRQRARKLPLYKCLINDDWESANMATIFVARQHASGNLTVCIYIVDLACLGIKDTTYRYNIAEEKLQSLCQNAAARMTFIEIPYNLAHNIIYAAIEYAAEYGFEPVPEFTSITQYILEEDDENIPLINIHCGGEDGKPLYVNTGFDSSAKMRKILEQLERTAGHGNYHYMANADLMKTNDGDEEYDDDDDDDDDNDSDDYDEKLRDIFNKLDAQELKTLFLETIEQTAPNEYFDTQEKLFDYIFVLIDTIIEKIVDQTKVIEHITFFTKDLDVSCVTDMFDLPNSFFSGLQCNNVKSFTKIWMKTIDDLESGKIAPLAKLHKITGDIPAIKYLELAYGNFPKEEYDRKLDEYSQKYPDYLLFKILRYSRTLELDESFKSLLSKHKPITEIEFVEFLLRYATLILDNDDITFDKLLAFEIMIRTYSEYNISSSDIDAMILLTKLKLIKKLYGIGIRDDDNNEQI